MTERRGDAVATPRPRGLAAPPRLPRGYSASLDPSARAASQLVVVGRVDLDHVWRGIDVDDVAGRRPINNDDLWRRTDCRPDRAR